MTIERWFQNHIPWLLKTFGTGMRTLGLIKHIQKELAEIEQSPKDLEEWIDVIVLASDGFWRAGGTPLMFMELMEAKQLKNLTREWTKFTSEDEPVEHIRKEKNANISGSTKSNQ